MEERFLSLPSPTAVLFGLIALTAVLLAIFVVRPGITAGRGGKILAFVAFLILPFFCVAWGASEHFDRSKQTSFCLSCHVMEPYGKSLYVDDPSYVAAAHFQNHRIPADEACYTCHTDYAFYGGIRAKLRGLRHIYVQYLGTIPTQIHLYSPYQNRECLHCHLGARSFESNPVHQSLMSSLKNNDVSCVSSGCHDTVHNVSHLGEVKFWTPRE
jgi:cytochrome c-type protein NapC